MIFKKLLIAETLDFSDEVIEFLSTFLDVTIKDIDKQELNEVFRNYDYFWFRLKFRITEELLNLSNRKVSVIITPVTGLDNINIIECNRLKIKVISLKGEIDFLKEIRATAEMTIALTLALLRKLPQAIDSTKKFNWDRNLFKGSEIYRKKVGIIGMGRLGKIVAKYFDNFGAKVFAYDIKEYDFKLANKKNSLIELVSTCDIISLHVDYNTQNHHLINSKLLKLFKKGSVFINTSRGSLVDSNALIDSLNKGYLSGVGLDVIENEYNVSDNILIKYSQNNENVIITPHIGGNTIESFKKTEMFIAKKLKELTDKNV